MQLPAEGDGSAFKSNQRVWNWPISKPAPSAGLIIDQLQLYYTTQLHGRKFLITITNYHKHPPTFFSCMVSYWMVAGSISAESLPIFTLSYIVQSLVKNKPREPGKYL